MIYAIYNTVTGQIRSAGMNTHEVVAILESRLGADEAILRGVEANPQTQIVQIVDGVPTVVAKP